MEKKQDEIQGQGISLGAWRGIVLVVFLLAMLSSCFTSCKKTMEGWRTISTRSSASSPNHEAPEFPIAGEGYAKKSSPVKCWLDPKRSYTRAPKPVRYVLSGNTRVFFDDIDPIGHNNQIWAKMPAGRYLVYSIEEDEILFRWWQ